MSYNWGEEIFMSGLVRRGSQGNPVDPYGGEATLHEALHQEKPRECCSPKVCRVAETVFNILGKVSGICALGAMAFGGLQKHILQIPSESIVGYPLVVALGLGTISIFCFGMKKVCRSLKNCARTEPHDVIDRSSRERVTNERLGVTYRGASVTMEHISEDE